jgi:hypothetical protein
VGSQCLYAVYIPLDRGLSFVNIITFQPLLSSHSFQSLSRRGPVFSTFQLPWSAVALAKADLSTSFFAPLRTFSVFIANFLCASPCPMCRRGSNFPTPNSLCVPSPFSLRGKTSLCISVSLCLRDASSAEASAKADPCQPFNLSTFQLLSHLLTFQLLNSQY